MQDMPPMVKTLALVVSGHGEFIDVVEYLSKFCERFMLGAVGET
jgi:hypothetical protein